MNNNNLAGNKLHVAQFDHDLIRTSWPPFARLFFPAENQRSSISRTFLTTTLSLSLYLTQQKYVTSYPIKPLIKNGYFSLILSSHTSLALYSMYSTTDCMFNYLENKPAWPLLCSPINVTSIWATSVPSIIHRPRITESILWTSYSLSWLCESNIADCNDERSAINWK